MRSATGEGYRLQVYEGTEVGELWRPGMFIVESGTWEVDTLSGPKKESAVFTTQESGMTTGPVRIRGRHEDGVLGFLVHTARLYRCETQHTAKPWGGETTVVLTPSLLKIIDVAKGHRTSEQYHQEKDEVLIPVTNEGGWIYVDGESYRHREHHFPPGTPHRACGPITMIEASTHHPDDVVRISDDYDR